MSKKQKLILTAEEKLESKLGFDLFSEGDKRLGWLLTFSSDGSTFKSKYKFRPYFYASTKRKMEMDVEAYLRRRYEGQIADIEIVEKKDLDLKNHLSGLRKTYLKISFETVQQLMHVKNDLMHIVERNRAKFDAAEAYESILTGKSKERTQDFIDCIADLREYDVPYHVRFAIDNDLRCGQWYDVSASSEGIMLERRTDLLQRAEVHVCAFDIETTKLPLKFPDAEYDSVMMISYMVDGRGYLLAPEYSEAGLVTTKMDVYAFGSVLLELVTGKEAVYMQDGKQMLLSEAGFLAIDGKDAKQKISYLTDARLQVKHPLGFIIDQSELASRLVKLSVACLEIVPSRRLSIVEAVNTLMMIQLDAQRLEPSFMD